ncbi:MAG: type IV secretory system conjugative DNA transfer family protein [Clostridia bacterium]
MNYDNYKFSQYETQNAETRWATMHEIQSTTLKINLKDDHYPYAGVPMINDGETAYIDNLDNHSLVFGSTGSKKTRLFCMPTLNIILKGGESFVTTDPKGELYAKTSGLAKELGYDVVVLNFRDLDCGDCWNPFSLPYQLYHQGDKDGAVARLNDFVEAISEQQSKTTKDIFWVTAAKSVALSVLITMVECCTKEECNIKTFTRFCSAFASGTQDIALFKACGGDEDDIQKNYLNEIMNLARKDSIARLNYDGLAYSSERAKGDIQGNLFTLISAFLTQENLVRNLSNDTFNMIDIGRKKTALYIIIPDERTNYHFIATTFIKQCYETLIMLAQNQETLKVPVRVNFVLDEFANIPKIPDMSSMISAGRSRDLKFFLVLQSMHQLRSKYGDDASQTIKGNCENWIFLASKELELLEEISGLAGSVEHYSKGGYQNVPLISQSQLQRLDKQSGEALIFCARHYPFISKMADIDDCCFPKLPSAPQTKIDNMSVISISPEDLYLDLIESKRNLPFKGAAMNGINLKTVCTPS